MYITSGYYFLINVRIINLYEKFLIQQSEKNLKNKFIVFFLSLFLFLSFFLAFYFSSFSINFYLTFLYTLFDSFLLNFSKFPLKNNLPPTSVQLVFLLFSFFLSDSFFLFFLFFVTF